jgi:hypothetical protein
MITLKDFMETVNYRVTEGSDYCWQCYGEHAYRLDYWNQEQDGHSVSIVFDTRSHVVYEATAYDYSRERAYRLINPLYAEQHSEEARSRSVDENQAWDDVDYVDLDVGNDFLEKARAIVEGRGYDTRVQVQVEFSDEELLTYMKIAHERDVTFNQLVEQALIEAIRDHEQSLPHWSNTDNPVDFPVERKKKKSKKRRD